ncbi:MAG: response regulator [Nitrospirota bacterium]
MSGKILVIDDEPLILTAVERALSKVGYIVSKASNMKELDSALSNAPFDLLITDLNMEEASFEDIIKMARSTSPSIKILKMSGSLNESRSDYFIQKPFRIDELRGKVRDILNEPS